MEAYGVSPEVQLRCNTSSCTDGRYEVRHLDTNDNIIDQLTPHTDSVTSSKKKKTEETVHSHIPKNGRLTPPTTKYLKGTLRTHWEHLSPGGDLTAPVILSNAGIQFTSVFAGLVLAYPIRLSVILSVVSTLTGTHLFQVQLNESPCWPNSAPFYWQLISFGWYDARVWTPYCTGGLTVVASRVPNTSGCLQDIVYLSLNHALWTYSSSSSILEASFHSPQFWSPLLQGKWSRQEF